jgi:ADP-heptose:LPS heptosyltransferase
VKILIIRLDHLGDLVLMTPLVRALAKAGHEVEFIAPRWLNVIFEGNPHLASTFAIEDLAPDFPRDWRRLSAWIRPRKYDCLLLPNSWPRQLLWCSFFSGVRQRFAMQAGVMGRITLHRCLRLGPGFMQGRHFVDIQLDFARALGVPTDGLKPDYFCRPEEILQAEAALAAWFPDLDGRPVIGIHPGCAGNTCNLPPRVYGEIAALILERSEARIVITGSAKERELLAEWAESILSSPRVRDSMGSLDVRSLAAVISRMTNYIIGSTGPLHLASAIGVRTTSPFCAVPPLTSSIWGNATGHGACVQPNPEGCRRYMAQAARYHHCDFRGEVRAEHIWEALSQEKSIQL